MTFLAWVIGNVSVVVNDYTLGSLLSVVHDPIRRSRASEILRRPIATIDDALGAASSNRTP